MKLRIAEKILKRYLQTKLFDEVNSKYPYAKMRATERDFKALRICKKFKDNEYWPFTKWHSGQVCQQ